MRLERCVWLCLGLAGCFSSPPKTTADGRTSGGSSSSGVGISAGVTTNIDPSSAMTTTTTTTDAESSSSSGATSSSSFSEGSTTTAEGCPGPGVCVPPAPPEWDGPATMLVGQSVGAQPMCPSESQELWRAGTDPAAPCDCSECGGEIGCDIGVEYGSNGFCETSIDLAGCQPFSSELVGQFVMSFDISTSPGASCDSPEAGEPAFRERAVGCAPNAEPCADGVCLLGPACISRPGEHECPPMYADRSLLYMSVTGSELSCDTCGCGDGESALFCSEATVAVYESGDCSDAPIEAPYLYQDEAGCSNFQDKASIVLIEEIGSIDIDIPSADCSADRDFENASGQFTEVGPRTVCCSG